MVIPGPGGIFGKISATGMGLALTALVRVVGGAANVISGSTSTIAAITDVCDGDQQLMTESLARFTGWAGVGIIIGPLIGNTVYRLSGDSDKIVYLVRMLICLGHTIWLRKCMPETLQPEKRKPFAGRLVNPFSFFGLFRRSKMLRRLVTFLTLQILTEGKNMNDLHQTWMRNNLGWSVEQAMYWTLGNGVAYFLASPIANSLIGALGPRGYTSFAMLSGICAYNL